MPVAMVHVVEGVLEDADKGRLIERITEALVEIEGKGNPNFAQYCYVIVDEVPSGMWGAGGKRLTSDDIRGLIAAR